MMFWNDGGTWAWWAMLPTMLILWAAIALLFLPWMRTNRDVARPPLERLDDRLATGEISVEEYRERRTELDHRSHP